MARLDDIHTIAHETLRARFRFRDTELKHPFPERPWRMLGLVKIDGVAGESEKLSRVLIMNTSIAAGLRGVRSVFVSPRAALDLPVFSSESILMGKKRFFLVDVQRRGGYGRHDDSALYDRLNTIKNSYPELLKTTAELKGEIKKTCSPAFCYVQIQKHQDDAAISLFHDYLSVFCSMVESASPLSGSRLEQAQRDFDEYRNTVIAHDPAVKIYKKFFGDTGGLERAQQLFFAQ
jgi:hypothetical protein